MQLSNSSHPEKSSSIASAPRPRGSVDSSGTDGVGKSRRAATIGKRRSARPRRWDLRTVCGLQYACFVHHGASPILGVLTPVRRAAGNNLPVGRPFRAVATARKGRPTYVPNGYILFCRSPYQPVCCDSALISARCGSTALVAARPPYEELPSSRRTTFPGTASTPTSGCRRMSEAGRRGCKSLEKDASQIALRRLPVPTSRRRGVMSEQAAIGPSPAGSRPGGCRSRGYWSDSGCKAHVGTGSRRPMALQPRASRGYAVDDLHSPLFQRDARSVEPGS
jgi:hypothetical protein